MWFSSLTVVISSSKGNFFLLSSVVQVKELSSCDGGEVMLDDCFMFLFVMVSVGMSGLREGCWGVEMIYFLIK